MNAGFYKYLVRRTFEDNYYRKKHILRNNFPSPGSFIFVGNSWNMRQKHSAFCFVNKSDLSEMWCFIAFGRSTHCFPAPACFSTLNLTHDTHLTWVSYVRWNSQERGQDDSERWSAAAQLASRTRVLLLRTKPVSCTVAPAPQEPPAGLRRVITNDRFCRSCYLQHPESRLSDEDCTSLAAFDVNSRDQPSALTARLCSSQDSDKSSHVP